MMSEKPEHRRLRRRAFSRSHFKELKQLHDNEEMLLKSYGWVDQTKGTVHIPIDQAIDIVAAKRSAGESESGWRAIMKASA